MTKTKTTHTPGKIILGVCSNPGYSFVYNDVKGPDRTSQMLPTDWAVLLAAAPDLLKAAKFALKSFEVVDENGLTAYDCAYAVALRAAIAKAEGGR